MPRRGRHSTCREIDLRSYSSDARASSSYLAATSAARLKTPELIRRNSNALTEDARRNRCGRFPASPCARHGRRRPPRGMPSATLGRLTPIGYLTDGCSRPRRGKLLNRMGDSSGARIGAHRQNRTSAIARVAQTRLSLASNPVGECAGPRSNQRRRHSRLRSERSKPKSGHRQLR